MGLLNLYKMQMMKPHIGYRYIAHMWVFTGSFIEPENGLNNYEYTIKKINQATFKINSEDKKYFGNTSYIVPILNFGETEMEITFEETENMEVYQNLIRLFGTDIYSHALMGLVAIHIKQFNEQMTETVDDKIYICRLKNYSEPEYSNNSFGSPIELNATFNVVYVIDTAYAEKQKIELDINGNILRSDDIDEAILKNEIKQQIANRPLDTEGIKREQEIASYRQQAIKNLIIQKRNEIETNKNKISEIKVELETHLKDLLNATITNKNFKLYNADAIKKQGLDPNDPFIKLKYNSTDKIDLTDGVTDKEKKQLLDKLSNYLTKNADDTKEMKEKNKEVLNAFSKKLDTYQDIYEKEQTLINDEQTLTNSIKNNTGEELLKSIYKDDALLEKDIRSEEEQLYKADKYKIKPYLESTVNKKAVSGNLYKREDYSKYQNMDLERFSKEKSYGYCSAYTSTYMSIFFNKNKRFEGTIAGKDYISNSVISEINKSGGTAKVLDYKPKTVNEINTFAKKYNKDNDKMLVTTIDLSGIPLLTQTKLKIKNPKLKDSFTYGHVVTTYKGNISQNQKTITSYSFITDEMIQSGQVKFKFMEVSKNKE